MRDGAILRAAMEVLAEVEDGGRPVDAVIRSWGKANRYAGSGDRARIGEIVYGVCRRRAECAFRMGADHPRALVLARAVIDGGLDVDALSALCTGADHSPDPLSASEHRALMTAPQDTAPDWVRLNLPEWLMGSFDRRFEPHGGMAACQARAPLDLRVNTLKTEMDAAHRAIRGVTEEQGRRVLVGNTPFSPWGLRITPEAGAGPRALPHLQETAPFRRGEVEIQDEGSQIVSLLSEARPGDTVIELCAGGGGKTLALGALMNNQGRIIAGDVSAARLNRAKERGQRAGLTHVESHRLRDWRPMAADGGADLHDPDLQAFEGQADLVFIDAPCSGSGTWRRQPEARWWLSPKKIADLGRVQRGLLARGARLVRPGGRLVYVTCSLFEAENRASTAAFVAGHPGFEPLKVDALWSRAGLGRAAPPEGTLDPATETLLLAPHLSGTDGFFFAAFRRPT